MSDYLWDKKGEPDADTRRLEDVLGRLRHRPRALEFAESSPPRTTTTTAHSASSSAGFSSSSAVSAASLRTRRAWLAVAAALVLAALAGALVVTRQFKTRGGPTAVARVSEGAAAVAATARGPGVKEDEKDAGENLPGLTVDERRAQVVAPKRGRAVARRESKSKGVVVAAAASRVGGSESASAEDEERGRLAKEQLVYALRLTNSKLREVQRKAQDIVDGAGGGPEGLR